ncbi:glycosyltransferase family 2 protein [Empedobacter falsenii]
MNQPLISVIVPCYNQAQYMDECLQSVLDQTYHNWECIIVNDGSPDHTEEVALQWTEKDTRFIYLKKENGGLSSARNAGIEVAKGEWILPLDCDDKIGSHYLELASAQFDKDYTVIYCEARYFGEVNAEWELSVYSLNRLAYSNIIFCSAFFRKKDFIKANGYDENLIYGLEDWDFWISLLKRGEATYKLNYLGFYYRIKKTSMLKDLQNERLILMQNLIFKKHIDFFLKEKGTYHENLKRIENLKKESTKLRGLYKSLLFRILIKLKLLN